MTFEENLKRLRAEYGEAGGGAVRDPEFRKVAEKIFDPRGTRVAPYAGIPTFLSAPSRQIDWNAPDFSGLQAALIGVPIMLTVVALCAEFPSSRWVATLMAGAPDDKRHKS